MDASLQIGSIFPDIELPDHEGRTLRLSQLTRPSQLDRHLGFLDGYPLILVFYRGFFCPRDQQQMRELVRFQDELAVNYGRLAAISADPPPVQAAFRAGLGARWPFLADEQRRVISELGILDETEGEYAYRAQPYTFVLRPDLRLHAVYNGWFFVGRPTLEELRHGLRAIMEQRADYRYDAYDTPQARAIRIPQQEWTAGAPPLGVSGLAVKAGTVRWFDASAGVGEIQPLGEDQPVFFHFSAIPGEGYRIIGSGTAVRFELVDNPSGPTARNIQAIEE
ncbi:MAG TPA: redoxin domain-containing protein [Ktedonobacterales bacterium]|jgi:cold shock CspA family protein/peroxiredoxin|nr:redoxin domain-containing protein [Ktedonobacterales bacterium]